MQRSSEKAGRVADWGRVIQRKLSTLALEPQARTDIFAELATHLEETCEAMICQGVPEEEAVRETLAHVGDWQKLARGIEIAKSKEASMADRIKQFWVPGLLTFVLSGGALALLEKFGPRPWVIVLRGVLPMGLLYIPWLLLLPVVGALGAYLSHRAGGSRRAVFASIVFPVLPFLAAILLASPVSLFFDRLIAHNIAPMSLVMALLGWVIVPGLALLCGGLPAHFFVSRWHETRAITNS